MLKNFGNKKTGVLVNEFGPTSIDSIRLSETDIKMLEINNGSIFCSCLKADFLKALIALSNEDIEVLFIENSGLADPSNMRTLLYEISKKTEKKYEYKGAICIVDAQSFLKHVKVLPAVQNQVAHSNFVVVNKVDKANKEVLNEVKKVIYSINPLTYIYQAVYAEVPLSIIESKLVDSRYTGDTSNKPCNRIATYALETDELLSKESIEIFVNDLKSLTYRIKGYVKTHDSWLSVDVTEDDVNLTEVTFGKKDVLIRTKLVLIGKSTEGIKDSIENSWNKVSSEKIYIYQ